MKLTRRHFLSWAGLSAVGAVSCNIFREGEMETQSPAQLPEDLVKGRDNWYSTLCRNCPSSEGIVVRVMEGRAKKIQGNPWYPTNQGKQHARCDAGLQALYHPDRLSGPMRRVGGRGLPDAFEPIDWNTALDTLRGELGARGNGMLLVTEPLRGHLGLIADRFAGAFGGQHLGFETLDTTTYRAAVKNVFDQDLLPDFDLENTRYLLSFGADFLSTWVSPTRWARGYGEFRRQGAGKERGTLVHVEPRFSMTAANADKWLPVKPGVEGHLAMSLAYVIISEGLQAPGVDPSALTGGQGAAALEAFNPETVGPMLGLPEGLRHGDSAAELIRELAHDFAGHRPSLAIGGDSAGAHANGLFNLEAIYALNYLVGSVGAPGGVKFNPGSPLPELPAATRVGTLQDWQGITDRLLNGGIRMVLTHQADPVHGLPDSVGFRSALHTDGLFIVSFSSFLDNTALMADLVLPDRISLEDWGDDIPEPGPGYQVFGVQQPVVNPLPDLDPRSFPNILLSMAQEVGRDTGLPWNTLEDALRQSAASLFRSNPGSVRAATEETFWTEMLRQGGWWDEGSAGPAPATPPGDLLNRIAAKEGVPADLEAGAFYLMPFAHNTLLDGRNAHLPWMQAAPDPLTTITWQTWVEMNDRKAEEMGLREGDIVEVQSSAGLMRAPLYPTPALPPNVIGVPLGQGHRSALAYASGREDRESSNVMDILETTRVEGSGALAWAGARVRVSRSVMQDSIKLSKFEGFVTPREVGVTEGEEIIKTIGPEES